MMQGFCVVQCGAGWCSSVVHFNAKLQTILEVTLLHSYVVCCSVVQCSAVLCSVVQCAAEVCRIVLQCVAVCCSNQDGCSYGHALGKTSCCSVLQCVAVIKMGAHMVLPSAKPQVAVRCTVLQIVAAIKMGAHMVLPSAKPRVAVRCSALQSVAASRHKAPHFPHYLFSF